MKSTLKMLSAAALTAAVSLSFAQAQTTPTPTPVPDAKDTKNLQQALQNAGVNYVQTAQKGITLSGFVDTSYTYQFAGAGENGVATSQAKLRQFDTSNNSFNINDVKIALEQPLSDKNELSAGFRVDTIFGSDAKYLGDSGFGQSATANNSAFGLEQAFVKVKIPVGNGVEVDFGKLTSLLGYEVIESPANPNFSRGLLFTNAIPLTQTGVLASYSFNDTFQAKFGIIDGWNESQTSNPLGQHSSFTEALTGQLTVNAPGKNANITTSFIASPFGDSTVNANDSGFIGVLDIWGNWTPNFIKDSKLLLGFNLDFGLNEAAGNEDLTGGTAYQASTQDWEGIALYSKYQFTKVFSLAGRAEYLHAGDAPNPKYGAAYNSNTFAPSELYATHDDFSYTLTAGFNIWDNLLTRVEYRYDYLSEYSAEPSQNEFSLNAVYSF